MTRNATVIKLPRARTAKKGQPLDGPFLAIEHSIFDSPEFKALSHVAVCMLLLLLRKYKPHLNGNIPLGVREAAAVWHCNQSTACRAIKELESGNFIVCTYKGHRVPQIGRPDAPSRWRINFRKGQDDE